MPLAQFEQIAEGLFAKLGPDILALIDTATREEGSGIEFVKALTNTQTFRNRFPGLMDGGTIAEFLSGGADVPVSVQSLATAITNYRTSLEEFRKAGEKYGITINKQMFKTVINRQTSLDEFAARLQAIARVQKYPNIEKAFNAQAKAFGIDTLDEEGIYRLAAGVADKKFYDVYEAAELQTAGLGFGKQQAGKLARQIGEGGVLTDISTIVGQAKQYLGDIAPELESKGISKAKLLKFIADPGTDPENLAPRIAQAIASKRARGSYIAGTQARRGPAGGLALQEAE